MLVLTTGLMFLRESFIFSTELEWQRQKFPDTNRNVPSLKSDMDTLELDGILGRICSSFPMEKLRLREAR